MKEVNYYGRSVGEEIVERKEAKPNPILPSCIFCLVLIAGSVLAYRLMINEIANFMKI